MQNISVGINEPVLFDDHRGSFCEILNTTKVPFNSTYFIQQNISLNKNFNIKFAGGWGTIISNDLIKEVPFPFHVKGYGREDTLVATWAYKHRYPQYILNNVIVQENRKYRCTFLYDNQIYYNTEFLTTNNEISKNHYYSLIDKILS